MRTLLVVAHPRPGALIHAMAQRFARKVEQLGGELELVDLYRDGFDPVVRVDEYDGWRSQEVPEDVAAYQSRLKQAQNLVLAYPVWWATPPAIMQGWLQRVMTHGFAFSFGEKGAQGHLQLKAGLLVNVGSPDDTLAAEYLEPIQGVLKYCGVEDIRTCVNWGIYPGADGGKAKRALRMAEEFAVEFV